MSGSWTILAKELIGDIVSTWVAAWTATFVVSASIASLVLRFLGKRRPEYRTRLLVETFWLTPLYLWGVQSLVALYMVDRGTHLWLSQGLFLSAWQRLAFESYFCLVLVFSMQCGALWCVAGRRRIRARFRGTLGWSALLTVGSVLLLINWKFLYYCSLLNWTIHPDVFR